ncbi:anti-sigma B factor antagonist [Actinoplanes philippinensis]|uniref:Anti-sigma factor antagonist n=1 Tax=Actinoplanes philippinensis TaxID=35752 RepID=A0A1I2L2W8_9ACTN|nr:STAS domain-containing protein [Actinoplanes philippinensis]SFF71797.1 anti-sigma B factor antagonist [Actinoplanes philippinensis]
MRITTRHDDDATRLVLAGDLDMATTAVLDDSVTAVLTTTRPRRLVIDAEGLAFCDSSGIHALMRARDRAQRQGTSFVVANPVGIARRTLEITGLLDVLTTATPPAES